MSATEPVEGWRAASARKDRELSAHRNRVFGKKATDQKVHENLFKSVDIYLSEPTADALRELRAALRLSERNLAP